MNETPNFMDVCQKYAFATLILLRQWGDVERTYINFILYER